MTTDDRPTRPQGPVVVTPYVLGRDGKLSGPQPRAPMPGSQMAVGTLAAGKPPPHSAYSAAMQSTGDDGAITVRSGTPLPLRVSNAGIVSNWDQPQPGQPQPSPSFVRGGPVEPPASTYGIQGNDVGLRVGRVTTVELTPASLTAGAPVLGEATLSSPISRNLSLQPEHIAEQVRVLVEAVRSQIAAMPATPNTPDKLEFHNGLIEFLEWLANGLSDLAETLDKMAANRGNANEPIFLGNAAKIANHLGVGAMDYIEKNREKFAGAMIQGSLIVAATLLAKSLGIDKELLEVIANIFGKGSK